MSNSIKESSLLSPNKAGNTNSVRSLLASSVKPSSNQKASAPAKPSNIAQQAHMQYGNKGHVSNLC